MIFRTVGIEQDAGGKKTATAMKKPTTDGRTILLLRLLLGM